MLILDSSTTTIRIADKDGFDKFDYFANPRRIDQPQMISAGTYVDEGHAKNLWDQAFRQKDLAYDLGVKGPMELDEGPTTNFQLPFLVALQDHNRFPHANPHVIHWVVGYVFGYICAHLNIIDSKQVMLLL